MYQMLGENKVDFAIVGDIPEDIGDRYYITELGIDRLVLIVPPNHPLGCREDVSLRDVVKYPLVSLTDDYGITSSLKSPR